MIARLLLIALLALPLGGCATLTAVTLGTAIGLGLASGAGNVIGEDVIRMAKRDYIKWKRCHKLWPAERRRRCQIEIEQKYAAQRWP